MKPPTAIRLTFDCVVFSILENKLHVAVARRQHINEVNQADPFPGAYSLPGGYVRDVEAIADTIKRRLAPEIGLELDPIHFAVFDEPNRDPRHRVVSIAYMALIPADQAHRLHWGPAYSGGAWEPVSDLPKSNWAFDHDKIVQAALKELQYQARREPTGFELLPERFDLRTLHTLQEQIHQEKIDIRNLRRDMLRLGLIVEKGTDPSGPGLPKKLYALNTRTFQKLKERGYYA
jgi:8-oxo-dGTP diphosphatase